MRPRVHTVLATAALAVTAVATCACTTAAPLSGRVMDDVVTVQVPALSAPQPDIDSGFGKGQGLGSAPAHRESTVAALTGFGQFSRIATVTVRQGDRVSAGDVIVGFDTSAFDANLAAAKAARAAARAQVPVIDDALDDINSGKAKIARSRGQVYSAITQITRTRATLVAKRAELVKLLKLVDSMGPGGPPPSLPPSAPPVPRPPLPDPAQLRAGIAKIDAGLAKIDAGLGKARRGLRQLASARARLSDARSQLKDLRTLARIAADASQVGIDLARYQRQLTTVFSPADGVVVEVAQVGDLLPPGATVASIRRDGPARVSTWVAPEDLRSLAPNPLSSAIFSPPQITIGADWLDGRLPGSVSRIGTRAVYPPTSFATQDIHLTRAVEVEIAVDESRSTSLPPGAPVDVYFE